MFQRELRRFLYFFDIKYLKKQFLKRKNNFDYLKNSFLKELAEVVFELAERKIGALIVLKRNDNLFDYLEGGYELFGKFSKPLLMSIFDPSSLGHDGAVIIEDGIVEKFGVVLPLSENNKDLKNLGTRHRAGLGLTEKTDALTIIVSEERGTVALCENGKIIFLKNQEDLISILSKDFVSKKFEFKRIFNYFYSLIKNYFFIFLFSIIVGFIFWTVNNIAYLNFVYQKIEAPIAFTKIPEKAVIEKLTSNYVDLVLLGSEKDFKFLNKENVKVLIDFSQLNLENKDQYLKIKIKPEFIKYPTSFKLIKFNPNEIEFKLNFEEN